jgi:2-dehydro-3-deoxyglucarate aldolase/4-hydroxy-2-oxoheptanedioate aldolase
MKMFENPLRNKLATNPHAKLIGTMLDEDRNPLIIPLLAKAGFDFVIIDCEHGTYTYFDVLQFCLAAKNFNMAVLARTPGDDYISLAKMWDSGVHGIMVPHIESKEQAEQIVNFSKYPPLGHRGYGPRGIITDFENLATEEKIARINQHTMLFAQLESETAVKNIESIATVSGIDGWIVGPMDLSISLGVPGRLSDPKFLAAFERILHSGQAHDIPVGLHVRSLEMLQNWQQQGLQILMYSTPYDMLLDTAAAAVKTLKG